MGKEDVMSYFKSFSRILPKVLGHENQAQKSNPKFIAVSAEHESSLNCCEFRPFLNNDKNPERIGKGKS
jgi:hypothetical protein